MKKRILSFLIVAVLLIGMMPISVSAASGITVSFNGVETTHTTIDSAWAAAKSYATTPENRATITVAGWYTATNTLELTEDYIVLNITTGTTTLKGGNATSGIYVTGGELEIIGNTWGTLSGSTYGHASRATLEVRGTGKVTLDGPKIVNTDTANSQAHAVVVSGTAEFNFKSGTISSASYYALTQGHADAKVNLYSGTIEGKHEGIIYPKSGTTNFKIEYAINPLIFINNSTASSCNILPDYLAQYVAFGDTLDDYDLKYGTNTDGSGATSELAQTDATLPTRATTGKKYLEIKTNTMVAEVSLPGETPVKYKTIDAAWSAAIAKETSAANQVTIRLLSDCLAEETLVNNDDHIILNTSTFTLTAALSGYFGGVNVDNNGIEVNGGSLNITGTGEITGNTDANYGAATLVVNGGIVTVNGAKISGRGSSASLAVLMPYSSTGEFHFVSGHLYSNEEYPISTNDKKAYLYSGTLESNGRYVSVGDATIVYSENPLIFINNKASGSLLSNLGDISFDDETVAGYKVTYGETASNTTSTDVSGCTGLTSAMGSSRYLKVETTPKNTAAADVTFDGNTEKFETIDEAWAAAIALNTTASKKATIKLLSDCVATAQFTNTEDYIVLDTNARTLTLKGGSNTSGLVSTGGEVELIGSGTIKGNTNSSSIKGVIEVGGKVTLDGPTVINNSTNQVAASAVVVLSGGDFTMKSGHLISENVVALIQQSGVVHLYSGTIESSHYDAFCAASKAEGGVIFEYCADPMIFINHEDAKIYNESYYAENIFFNSTNIGSCDVVYSANADGSGATTVTNHKGAFTSVMVASRYLKVQTNLILSFNVTVDYGTSGLTNETSTVVDGTIFNRPADPDVSGYTFVGWYADDAYTTEFDFTQPITATTTIYAKFVEWRQVTEIRYTGSDSKYMIKYNDGTSEIVTFALGVKNVSTSKVNGVTTVTIEFTDPAIPPAVFEIEDGVADAKVELNAAIDALDTAMKQGDKNLSDAIAALKTALDAAKLELNENDADLAAKIEAANNTLDAAIKAVQKNLEDAKTELNAAIATGDAELSGKITALTNALAEAKAILDKADVDLAAKIEAADNTLDAAIKKVQKNLEDAKTELNAAIATGDAELSGKITALTNALAEAKAVLDKADADLVAADATLAAAIETLKTDLLAADAVLTAAIETLKANLESAKAELDAAIKNGDTVLNGKITTLTAALEAAKAALDKADADLVAKIEAADNTLDAAIKAVQKNLEDAKAELDTAIKNGDTALDTKISALNEALANAKAALEASDTANKNALTTKIDEADAAMKTAVDTLSTELGNVKGELESKDAQLQTFITVVSVVSGVAFCGTGAFVTWFFIARKRRII